jgi:hypothetical protein
MAKIQIKWLNNKMFATADDLKVTQVVNIVQNDRGDCVTTHRPTNEQLASLADIARPPKFVTRLLFFDFGVPPAYDWLNPNPIQRTEPSVGIQLFSFSDWLKQVETEKTCGAGHLAPFQTALLANPG